MSTLRETDEGRARPSVWPVYLTAAGIGVMSLLLLSAALVTFTGSAKLIRTSDPWDILLPIYALLGLLTASGIIRLRLWAWWCAMVWIIICVAASGSLLLPMALSRWRGSYLITGVAMFGLEISVLVTLLLVWPLATRRRLFFPPKPEAEE